MMKPIIMNINDMSDSVEVYETKPNKAIPAFIYICTGLVISAVLWAMLGTIDVSVSAKGIIRPADDVNTCVNAYAGTITKVNVKNGDRVSAGDILYEVDSREIVKEKEYYEECYKEARESLAGITEYYDALITGTFFGGSEKYRTLYEAFAIHFDSMYCALAATESDNNYKRKMYEDKIIELDTDKKGNEELLTSIRNGYEKSDYISVSLYKLKYETYLSEQKDLKDSVEKSKKTYDAYAMLVGLAVTEWELEEAKREYAAACESLERHARNYEIELENTLISLKDNIASCQNKLEEIRISDTQLMVRIEGEDRHFGQTDKLLKDELSEALQNITDCRNEVKQLETKLFSLDKAYNECVVSAQSDGIVSILTELVEGNSIRQGVETIRIIPDNENGFKCTVYVDNSDRGKVEPGMRVKFDVYSYPGRQYGYLYGSLDKVSKDITMDSATGTAYYVGEASVSDSTFLDKEGNVLPLESGMICEAKIISGEKKIMRWILEKISLAVEK